MNTEGTWDRERDGSFSNLYCETILMYYLATAEDCYVNDTRRSICSAGGQDIIRDLPRMVQYAAGYSG